MLVALALALALILGSGGVGAPESGCVTDGRWSGCTSTSIDGSEVVIESESTTPGSGARQPTTPGGQAGVDTGPSVDQPSCEISTAAACTGLPAWGPDRDDYLVLAVTLADIARFRPSPAVQVMEPDGWAVVGLPTNVYARAEPQIVAGALLGEAADVRFTPVGFRWAYGDGSSATSRSPGAPWAHLGLREFDATSTSHTYRRAGDHTIHLTVTYRAEYRIGGGDFVRIPGTLTLATNDLRVTVRPAKTVLVGRNCTRQPSGPGC